MRIKHGTNVFYIENRFVKNGLLDEVIKNPGWKPTYFVQIGKPGFNKYVGTKIFLTKIEACQHLHERLCKQLGKIAKKLVSLQNDMQLLETSVGESDTV